LQNDFASYIHVNDVMSDVNDVMSQYMYTHTSFYPLTELVELLLMNANKLHIL